MIFIAICLWVSCSNKENKTDESETVQQEPIGRSEPEKLQVTSDTEVYNKVSVEKAFDMVKVLVAKQLPFPDEVEFPSRKEFNIVSNKDNSHTFKASIRFLDSFKKMSVAKWEATIVLEGDENVASDWGLSDFYIE